jgi:hypothetical protein
LRAIILLASILAIAFATTISESHAEQSIYTYNDKQNEFLIPYEISNGELKAITRDCTNGILRVSVDANDDGLLKITIPYSFFTNMFGPEILGNFFVIINREEITVEINKLGDDRVYSVPFSKGISKIDFFASFTPERGNDNICGMIDADYSIYSLYPPKLQIKNGVIPEDVLCKYGLNLVFKTTDYSPVCVKTDTIKKLINREWVVFSPDQVWYDSSPIRYEDIDFQKHTRFLKIYYKDQGIEIMKVNYSMFNEVMIGEYCEGSYSDYNISFVISKSDREKIADVKIPEYYPEADRCTGLP